MRKIFGIVLAILLICRLPAFAETIYISDQGGSHIGYCHDNHIWAAAPTYHYGSETTFTSGDLFGSDIFPLLRFTVASIPDGADVTAVSLTLRCTAVGGGGETVAAVTLVDANYGWLEGTSADNKVGYACWNKKIYNTTNWANGTTWTTSGNWDTICGIVNSTTTGTKTLTFLSEGIQEVEDAVNTAADTIEFAVTASDYSSNVYATFASSENATTAYRPYLTVTYSEPNLGVIVCGD